jgi:hypothetical protein
MCIVIIVAMNLGGRGEKSLPTKALEIDREDCLSALQTKMDLT